MKLHKRQLARLAGILTATTMCCGTAMTVVPLGADGAKAPSAHAARTTALNETGHLHLLSKHGFTFNEQGTASGTIKGAITVHLKITSSSSVSAEVTISPKGGSISGSGTASYHKGEALATFAGRLSINHRSGTYAHAQGSGLSFSGTIARSNYAITVHVNGRLTD
jgi:hypothetical protein